jgi:hypothetical protein
VFSLEGNETIWYMGVHPRRLVWDKVKGPRFDKELVKSADANMAVGLFCKRKILASRDMLLSADVDQSTNTAVHENNEIQRLAG